MLGPIGKNLSVESFQDFWIEFDMKFDLIFKILYFPKMCPIFVGSVAILVGLTVTLFSEKMLIFTRCIHGFMTNWIKKS